MGKVGEYDRADMAWCVVDQRVIFLDVAQDRYFALPEGRNRAFIRQVEKSGFADGGQPSFLPRPADWISPSQAFQFEHQAGFSLARIARALWVQRRIESRLKSGVLAELLFDLRTLVERRAEPSAELGSVGEDTVRAFEQARLLRTTADRCLARSIALSFCLASQGEHSRVVLGVRSAPFGAHCWTQKGDTVLNDSLEEVLRFQPILVV
ncbi:MAG: lasso peptide biosynthesis B2 protein [Qipengyuania pacifica]|jgi:hypothetical protein|tara:strand:- start:12601 stop:13227 length:627 start_codon:yes stop_codon:yes gene_type:complete